MNDKHRGPHCAGYCEGEAYQIEIRRLRDENEALREVLNLATSYVELSVDEAGGEESVEAEHVLKMIRQALAAHDKGGV